jgi:hypothetical protein
MTIKFPYTRTPKGTEHPLTVGTAADLQVDAEGGKWVVQCDDHGTLVNVDTQVTALGITALDFCDFCRDEANGVATDEDSAFDAALEALVAPALAEADDAIETGHALLLAAIAGAVVAGDNVARDAAIVAGANAGIARSALAEAAGLARVGRIIREGGATKPRSTRVSEYTKGYRAAVADVAAIVETGRDVKARVASWVLDHTDAPAEVVAA